MLIADTAVTAVGGPCWWLNAGIRRVEVPGDRPELSYPRDRSVRFTDELISAEGKIFKYRWGCVRGPNVFFFSIFIDLA